MKEKCIKLGESNVTVIKIFIFQVVGGSGFKLSINHIFPPSHPIYTYTQQFTLMN